MRRKALALLAASAVLGSLTVVFSPAAWGNPPSVECASDDPEWDDNYWKVQIDSGTLSTVETTLSGAISLDADGSWTNDNDDDSVFRIVLKVGSGVDNQILSGMWEPGEGGTIDLTHNELGHVTFCFTDDDDDDSEEPESTTTTTTTTTSASFTTTTSAGPTTTTSSEELTATTLGGTTTTLASDETTTNAAASLTEVSDSALVSDPSEPNESTEADGSKTDFSEWPGPEGSSPDANRDTEAGLMIGGSGPPAPGQAPISSNAVQDMIRSSDHWLTLANLAILGALIAAIAVVILIDRRRFDFRRLVVKAHPGKRWR